MGVICLRQATKPVMLRLVHSPKITLKYISIGARSDQEQAEVQAPHLAWKTLLILSSSSSSS